MLMNRTEVGHAGVACHTRLVSCRVAASSNNRINSDWQFRCAPLPAGYAGRYVCNTTKRNERT
jgi:hypothetical protein